MTTLSRTLKKSLSSTHSNWRALSQTHFIQNYNTVRGLGREKMGPDAIASLNAKSVDGKAKV